MSQQSNIKKNFSLFLILNVFFVVGAIYLANYIFVQWQKIPTNYFSDNTIYLYHQKYGAISNVATSIKASIMGGCMAWLTANATVAFALFAKPKRELHGSARFANDMEIRKAGFLHTIAQEKKLQGKFPSEPPVIIGKHKEKFLQFYGNEFISIGAPTRSGKGVSIVIANLLTYPDSIGVLYIKM